VEGVEDVNSLRTPGQVNHAVGAACVRNANLLDTLADGGLRARSRRAGRLAELCRVDNQRRAPAA
jgi:hypothetical protein